MKRTLVLALGLLVAPTLVSAQVEIGLDAGFMLKAIDDADDNVTSIALPSTGGILPMTSGMRVAFTAGETVLVESLLNFSRQSEGDESITILGLVPGVNILLGEQFYVRGEAGMTYLNADSGGVDESTTQYLFGGGAGIRSALGDAALLRVEGAVDRLLENTDDGVPASWDFRLVVGVSAVVN